MAKGQGGGGKRAKYLVQPNTINPLLNFPYDVRFNPIKVPGVHPFAPPTVGICLNPKWLGHLDGVLERLAFEDAWQGTPEEIAAAIEGVKEIQAALGAGNCSGGYNCLDYPPHSGIITYAPNDPFRTPNLVPTGYALPPWYTNPAVPWPGVLPGDALVNYLSLGNLFVSLPTVGLPRARISWTGRATVEIEFVALPQGGLALITWDDNPFTAQLVDLTSIGIGEITSVGFILGLLGLQNDASITSTRIVQYGFSTDGAHHIDITFLPNLDESDEVILGFGGGLRRVEICGESDVSYFELRQSPLNPCLLEQRLGIDQAWIPAFDFEQCEAIGAPTQPDFTRYSEGGIYEESYDGGQTWQERKDKDERYSGARDVPYSGNNIACLVAANIVAVAQTPVSEVLAGIAAASTVVKIVAALAAFLTFILTGGAALPLVFPFVAFMLSLGADGIGLAFTPEFWDDLRCKILCEIPEDGVITESVYNNVMNALSAEAGVAWQAVFLMFKIAGPVGLDRMAHRGGVTSADCSDCDTCPTCERDYDFLGAILHSDVEVKFGAHVPGEGVKTVAWTSYTDYAEVWVYFDQPCTARQAYVTCYSQNGTGNQLGVYWYNRQPDGSYTQITAGNYALQTGVSTAAPGCPASYDAIRLMLNPANNRKRALHKLRLEPS